MALYDFRREDAERFAREQGARVRTRGDELEFQRCPYCNGGNKDKFTFSINLKTGAFKCLRASCGAHGNMITLHKDFNFSLGTEADAYYGDGYKHFRSIHRKQRAETTSPAVEYMKTRGISQEVTERYGITTQKANDSILVFPFYDADGILRFVKYRNTEFTPGNGSKEWCEANCMPILFGMDHCNPDKKTLIMTEGQIDSLSVTEAGFENAVSVPTGKNGFTWVPYCWDFLNQFETLIVFGDHERDEITLLDEMRVRFNGTVKHVRPEDYRGCKDANDILRKFGKDAIRDAINNAVPVEVAEIKQLADVERVDLSTMKKFSSGISAVDEVLGGFYFGQLVVITGERGEGKSTLASQFATMGIKAGHSVFFYSGELMDWYFRAWIDYQIAGPEYINTMCNTFGHETYSIDGNVYPGIAEWYRGRFFLYDNSSVLKEDREGLIPTVIKAIRQHGCSIVFIDNLMTAISDDITSDIYRQQTEFVKKLANIAKQMNVIIFLIAHPRKTNGYSFENDDVAGSSNITNLADVVMRYARPKGEDEDEDTQDRLLQITKNRLTGRTDRHGIRLFFDERSKRIGEMHDWDWKLGWEPKDGFRPVTDGEVDF